MRLFWVIFAAFALGFGTMPVYRRADAMFARTSQAPAPDDLDDVQPFPLGHYQDRVAFFRLVQNSPARITILGDSRVEFCNWEELLGHPDETANRGIAGDTLRGLADRVAASVPAASQICVVQIGVNDLRRHLRVDTAERLFQQILAELHDRKQKIILTSVLATDDVAYPWLNGRIADLNSRLQRLAEQCPDVTWLDLNAHLAARGNLSPTYTTDGIHLSTSGYLAWRDLLTPLL